MINLFAHTERNKLFKNHKWFCKNKEPLETKDVILTKNYLLPCDNKENGLNNLNTITIASVGSGKTRGFVKGNLLNKGSSFVITDVKGDLVNQFGTFFKVSQGQYMPSYKLKILDLKNFKNSLQYNPFKYIHNDLDVEAFAKASVANLESRSEPVWHQWAECLLKSMIHFMFEEYPKNEWNIKTILDIFKNLIKKEIAGRSMYGITMDSLPDDSKAKGYYKEVSAENAEGTWNCITAELGNALQQFENIQDIMIDDELELENIGNERTALFIIIDDTMMSVLGFIIGILYTQLFQILCREAGKTPEKKLPEHVRFIMDDFANYILPNISDMISSVRSRNISMHMILQSESQLYSNYGTKTAQNIIANCAYVYIAGNDFATIQNIAARTGCSIQEIQNMTNKCVITFPEGKTIIDEKFAADKDHPFYRYIDGVWENYSTSGNDLSFWSEDESDITEIFDNKELKEMVAKSFKKNSEWIDKVLPGLKLRETIWDSDLEKNFYRDYLLKLETAMDQIFFEDFDSGFLSVEFHVPLREIFVASEMMNKAECIGWKIINMHADFVIFLNNGDGRTPLVVFEVDGEMYHNKTEQKKNDRLKDLLFSEANIPFFRVQDCEIQSLICCDDKRIIERASIIVDRYKKTYLDSIENDTTKNENPSTEELDRLDSLVDDLRKETETSSDDIDDDDTEIKHAKKKGQNKQKKEQDKFYAIGIKRSDLIDDDGNITHKIDKEIIDVWKEILSNRFIYEEYAKFISIDSEGIKSVDGTTLYIKKDDNKNLIVTDEFYHYLLSFDSWEHIGGICHNFGSELNEIIIGKFKLC